MREARLSRTGQWFRAIAFFEAFSWAGLLIGMWLKYGTQTTDAGVWLFGRVHGAAFLAYLLITFIAWVRLRWPLWAVLLALLAAIPPLLTIPAEILLRRKGWLSALTQG